MPSYYTDESTHSNWFIYFLNWIFILLSKPFDSFNKSMKSKHLNHVLMKAESNTNKAFSSYLGKAGPNIEIDVHPTQLCQDC